MLEETRDRIDTELIAEKHADPTPYLRMANALDKVLDDCQEPTPEEIHLIVSAMVHTHTQFPFSCSWWIGEKHFVKSETMGLRLYKMQGNKHDLKNRKIIPLGVMAIINADRTGWEMVK